MNWAELRLHFLKIEILKQVKHALISFKAGLYFVFFVFGFANCKEMTRG